MTDLEDFSKGFLAGWQKTLMDSMEKIWTKKQG